MKRGWALAVLQRMVPALQAPTWLAAEACPEEHVPGGPFVWCCCVRAPRPWRPLNPPPSWPPSHPASLPSRKCYYPGALALYSELDRSFAKRYGAVLQRLRESERRQARGLPPLPPMPAAHAAPGQGQGQQPQAPGTGYASPEAELGGTSPVASVGGGSPLRDGGSGEEEEAQRTPPAVAPRAEPTFSLTPHRQPSGDSAREADDAVATAASALAAEAEAGSKARQEGASAPGEASAAAPRTSQPVPVPRDPAASLRHCVSGPAAFSPSMGRPPRSPRPGARRSAPPYAAASAAGPLSPASLRSLPQGDPLSPSGASPTSSGLPVGLEEASSLAGSTWGASSLATRGNGSAELADTLSSRLRPLLVPHGGGGSAGSGAARMGALGRSLGSMGARSSGGGAAGDAGWRAEHAAREREPHQEGSNLVFLSARPESYKVSGVGMGSCWAGGFPAGAAVALGMANTCITLPDKRCRSQGRRPALQPHTQLTPACNSYILRPSASPSNRGATLRPALLLGADASFPHA